MLKLKENIIINNNKTIFNASNGDSFTVNNIGFEIIKKLKSQESIESVTNNLAKEYNVSKATIKTDMMDFITLLHSYDLLENE